ncbi:MAG: protein kinase [Candidatus Sumerlaeaceae bacterium]|nr:protein kinase [Candidatus Sumerlaeaceae bacterium]
MEFHDDETYNPHRADAKKKAENRGEVDTEASTMERSTDYVPMPATWPGEISGYVLTQKIAEGGFSEIWEALQVELGRIVAIKRLKVRPDKSGKPLPISPRHIVMFEQEAFVAAHLEHPSILPVYALHRDAEGLPMLVMKRVRGEPWSDVIARDFDALPPAAFLRKHIPILAAVARAVAYAHAEGIVHRDLKPSQVMIGPFGEVLLMDWGLAMAYPCRVDDPDAPEWLRDPNALVNRPLNPAGTPSYMAPEQTESLTHRLGPWTDVYLLGGILYRLLTGFPPHCGRDGSETFKLAQAGVVEDIRVVAPDRNVPAELAELALKALEPEIERRLPSAEEFLRALEEHLVGANKQRESVLLAVRARDRLKAPSLGYETLAEVLTTLERALVLWPDNQEARKWHMQALEKYARLAIENRDLKLARLQAERLPFSDIRTSLLTHIAELEEKQLQRERELAQANERVRQERNRAEQLVGHLVGDLYRQLRRVGRIDVLSHLCELALGYLEKLDMENEEPAVVASRVRAYLNIADVHMARGMLQQAAQALNRVLGIVQKQLDAASDSDLWSCFHAQIWRRLGEIAYHRGDYQRAKEAFECGCEAIKGVLLPEEMFVEHEVELVRLIYGLGLVNWRIKNLDTALSFHMEADALATRLSRKAPHEVEYLALRGTVLATLGNVYRDLGDYDFAISVTREALQIRERIIRLDPGDLSQRGHLLWVRNNLGLLYLVRGQQEEAKALFLSNCADARELIKSDPTNIQHVRDLGFAASLAGEIAYLQGDLKLARELVTEANIVSAEIARREEQSLYAQCGLARTQAQLGEVYLAQGHTREALMCLRTAAKHAGEILEVAPLNPTGIKTWVRAALLRLLAKDEVEDKAVLLEHVKTRLSQLTSPSDELDRLDNEAALALVEGESQRATALLQQLRARHWLAPVLQQYALDNNISLE